MPAQCSVAASSGAGFASERSGLPHGQAGGRGALSSVQVWAKMREVPLRRASGAITRRNMLGYIFLNGIFWV